MNRRLLLLNLALAAAVAALVWMIRDNSAAAGLQQQRFFAQPAKPRQVPVHAPADPAKPIEPGAFLSVAEKMLFSRDRNANVVVETPPEKAVPPFPAAFGVLAFGGDVSVILADGAKQKGFRAGDRVGEFTLAAISGEELTFEWEGKRFQKTVAELKPKVSRETSSSTAPDTPVAQSALPPVLHEIPLERQHAMTSKDVVDAATKPKDGGPGLDVGGQERPCAPDDSSPAGTIVGGYRKVVSQSPFSKICRWVPVNR